MTSKPFHKLSGDDRPAAQIINPVKSNIPDVYLKDYIARKTKEKLTFEQWWNKTRPHRPAYEDYIDWVCNRSLARQAWDAAKEN